MKLDAARPTTLSAASRVEGIRPATMLYLHQFLRGKKKELKKAARVG